MHKFLVFIFFFSLSYNVNAHVQHYDNLKSIEFDIYRNNKNIGKHVFKFEKVGDNLNVESEINFEIIKLGVSLYKYYVKGTETYKNGELVSFNSTTNANGKDKFVNLSLKDNNNYLIDGSSFKGEVPNTYLLGTWWNHSIVKSPAQISAVSGRIIKQKVSFLGKETLKINEKIYETLHFNFSSSDPSLSKDKKLNTDIWYDEKTLNWIKATFKKKGKWEYRLISIK
jgi:hypothetical protein